MIRWLTILFVLAVPTIVTAQNLSDPSFMQNVVGAVREQRNSAQDQLAVASAQLAAAQARIAELEKQLAAALPKEEPK